MGDREFLGNLVSACLEEIPDLVAITASHRTCRCRVAMEFQDPKQVLQFAEGMFVNYPMCSATGKPRTRSARSRGLPTTFIYDPKGKLAVRHVGKITREQIEHLLDGKG